MHNKITLETTHNGYSDNDVVNKYINEAENIGLWESEKIIFAKYLKPEMNILDLGCGAGRTTFNLYKLGYKSITGLDLSEAMIDACRKRARNENLDIDFIAGNACETNLQSNSYDACIFSFNGLMTIPSKENRAKVFAEVFRMLKDGGIFIFTTHDIENETYRAYWAEEKERWEKGEHDPRLIEYGDMIFTEKKSGSQTELFLHIPTYGEISEQFQNAGFTIIERSVRSEICHESEAVLSYSFDCMFWVLKKG